MSEVYMHQSCKVYQNLLNRARYSARQFSATAFQKHSFLRILTQFDPISGPSIAFSRAAAEINNKDTSKVGRKITKITDLNLEFFFGDWANSRMKFPAEL